MSGSSQETALKSFSSWPKKIPIRGKGMPAAMEHVKPHIRVKRSREEGLPATSSLGKAERLLATPILAVRGGGLVRTSPEVIDVGQILGEALQKRGYNKLLLGSGYRASLVTAVLQELNWHANNVLSA